MPRQDFEFAVACGMGASCTHIVKLRDWRWPGATISYKWFNDRAAAAGERLAASDDEEALLDTLYSFVEV